MRLGQGTLRSGQSLSVTERKTAQDNPTTAGHRHERTVRQSSPMRSLTLVTVPTTRRNASHMSTVLEHVRCQQRRDALAEKDERLAGGAVPTGARYLGRDVASRLGQRQSQRRTHQSCAELAVRRHDSAMSDRHLVPARHRSRVVLWCHLQHHQCRATLRWQAAQARRGASERVGHRSRPTQR